MITRAAAQSLQASSKAMDLRSVADRLDEVARRLLVLVETARRTKWTDRSEIAYQHLLKLRLRCIQDIKLTHDKLANELSEPLP